MLLSADGVSTRAGGDSSSSSFFSLSFLGFLWSNFGVALFVGALDELSGGFFSW